MRDLYWWRRGIAGSDDTQLRLLTFCIRTMRAAARRWWPRRGATSTTRAPQGAAPVFHFILTTTAHMCSLYLCCNDNVVRRLLPLPHSLSLEPWPLRKRKRRRLLQSVTSVPDQQPQSGDAFCDSSPVRTSYFRASAEQYRLHTGCRLHCRCRSRGSKENDPCVRAFLDSISFGLISFLSFARGLSFFAARW